MEFHQTLIIAAAKGVVLLAIVLGLGVPGLAFAERRLGGMLQGARGPNRTGLGGLLQPLADGLKLLGKGGVVPPGADRLAFILGPLVSLLAPLAVCAAIPIGQTLSVAGRSIALRLADPGVVYILAAVGLATFSPLLVGWGSGEQRALAGGLRGMVQQASYGLCLGLAMGGIVVLAGGLGLDEIVRAQTTALGPLPRWNLWTQPLGGMVALVCVMAWSGMPPFEPDSMEEQIVGGYRSEYGGVRLALLEAGGQARRLAGAGLWVTLYAGGWHLPHVVAAGVEGVWEELLQAGAFATKVILVLGLLLWVRWSIPSLRYDQAMRLVWKVLLPLAFINLVWAGVSAALLF